MSSVLWTDGYGAALNAASKYLDRHGFACALTCDSDESGTASVPLLPDECDALAAALTQAAAARRAHDEEAKLNKETR